MSGPAAAAGRGHLIDAVRVDGPEWAVGSDESVIVPEDAAVPGFVLRELFARVEGPGPWRADVSPAEGIVHSLVLGVDGSVSEAVNGTGAGPDRAVEPMKIPKRPGRRRAVLIGAGVAGVLAVVAAGVVVASSSLPRPTPEASGAPVTASPLWTVPEGVSPLAAAGSVVAGVDGQGLVLLSGKDGSRIPISGAVKVADTSAVRAGAGDGLGVVDTGNGSGVAVVDGKAAAYEGKGSLLTRGPVPVLVGGSAQGRNFYVFRAGAPVQIQSLRAGDSLFGGMPGGGSVWAVSGGKVTYVPAAGVSWTVALSAPVAGASVASWVSVNERRTVVIWQAGASRVLAVHSTGPGASGGIEFQQSLAAGEEAVGTSGQVLIGSGPDSAGGLSTVSGVIALGADKPAVSAPGCAGPVVAAGTLWCPADAGSWSVAGFTVPGKPLAAGDGFVLVTEGKGQAAVPGPKP
ncbi:hypothetical protein ABH924_004351 [Arthrobacter sp. GAS37]|uniref:hypothetical protein n=1 Tax=Arthrobacter sp. GAS37 TaxID=3156261 RepID=UPI003835262A